VQPVFYYDLGSPQCYLLGETIMSTLPVVPEWEPVLASQIAGSEPQAETDRSEVERLAIALGVQALRWPRTWPPADTTRAMLAATYAKSIELRSTADALKAAAARAKAAGIHTIPAIQIGDHTYEGAEAMAHGGAIR
jgi:2-hydroxychromene-2-carboxylate isomerase